ncbi:VOC family protein [Paenibacillus antri]|uniref:VOC family protein n=1 Tax=Paenibacillus antri TaxID=2582848 RepID=UPI0013050BCB|nr:VOC family protein [Paenibacillus antri]
MNRVVHFELLSRDPGAAASFYADVFGWKTVRGEGDYYRLITGEEGDGTRGINGAAVRPMLPSLPAQTVNTIHVKDLPAYAEKVRSRGGRTLSDVIPLAGVGRFQYCADPDGTPFGLIEYDD